MAADDASSSDTKLPLATILHMLTIKLSSTNFLLWRNQVLPLLAYQNLAGHVNGDTPSPSPTTEKDGVSTANPAFVTWQQDDQRALILLQSSLTEESMAEVLGLKTSREIG